MEQPTQAKTIYYAGDQVAVTLASWDGKWRRAIVREQAIFDPWEHPDLDHVLVAVTLDDNRETCTWSKFVKRLSIVELVAELQEDRDFVVGSRVKLAFTSPLRIGTVTSVDPGEMGYLSVRWDDGRSIAIWKRDRALMKQDLIAAIGDLA